MTRRLRVDQIPDAEDAGGFVSPDNLNHSVFSSVLFVE